MATVWWQQSGWWLVIMTAAIALLLVALVIYTVRLWRSNAALLSNASTATMEANRAYLGVEDIFFSEGDEETAIQKISIRNFGQTPAHRVWMWCERASHLPASEFSPEFGEPAGAEQMFQPVQVYTRTLERSSQFGITKRGFFTYGRIVYKDIYGRWWTTCFCYHHNAEVGFVPYGDFNREEGPFDRAPL
jgi:hypothetical protein